jgi:hypothetical protein
MAWASRLAHLLATSGRSLSGRAVDLLTARNTVVVSTSCGIVYALAWLLALLQTNGLISTPLPVLLADAVIIGPSGGPLRPASLSPEEQAPPTDRSPGEPANQARSVAKVTLQIESQSPAHLWVLDDHGRRIGTDPETGLARLQIDGASYTGKGTSPELIAIPNADGDYRVQMSGRTTGSYDLHVRLLVDGDIQRVVQYRGTGEIFADTVLQTIARVLTREDGSPYLQVSSVQVLMKGEAPGAYVTPVNLEVQSSPAAESTPHE